MGFKNSDELIEILQGQTNALVQNSVINLLIEMHNHISHASGLDFLPGPSQRACLKSFAPQDPIANLHGQRLNFLAQCAALYPNPTVNGHLAGQRRNLNEKIRDLYFQFRRALNLEDYRRAAGYLEEVVKKISDPLDPRHRQAAGILRALNRQLGELR